MKSPPPATSPTAKGPRTKPAEVRLDELMNAAEALFLAHGVEATTINDIVARCQVAKGTFYHYFASKTVILDALARRYTGQFLQRLEDAVNACAPQDWSARLRAWVHANVITYLDTSATHDFVYANHHHHNRLNADRNAILEQLAPDHATRTGQSLHRALAPDPKKRVARPDAPHRHHRHRPAGARPDDWVGGPAANSRA